MADNFQKRLIQMYEMLKYKDRPIFTEEPTECDKSPLCNHNYMKYKTTCEEAKKLDTCHAGMSKKEYEKNSRLHRNCSIERLQFTRNCCGNKIDLGHVIPIVKHNDQSQICDRYLQSLRDQRRERKQMAKVSKQLERQTLEEEKLERRKLKKELEVRDEEEDDDEDEDDDEGDEEDEESEGVQEEEVASQEPQLCEGGECKCQGYMKRTERIWREEFIAKHRKLNPKSRQFEHKFRKFYKKNLLDFIIEISRVISDLFKEFENPILQFLQLTAIQKIQYIKSSREKKDKLLFVKRINNLESAILNPLFVKYVSFCIDNRQIIQFHQSLLHCANKKFRAMGFDEREYKAKVKQTYLELNTLERIRQRIPQILSHERLGQDEPFMEYMYFELTLLSVLIPKVYIQTQMRLIVGENIPSIEYQQILLAGFREMRQLQEEIRQEN